MSQTDAVVFSDFLPEYADELVAMWRPSFEQAVGLIDPHPVEEQREFLLNEVVPGHRVRVAFLHGTIVGFIAATQNSIGQLYVHVDYQGRGIGSQMLDWAKRRSNGSLWLYTFECNIGAQRFYESRGFTISARGFEQQWQLRDIKYQWTAPG